MEKSVLQPYKNELNPSSSRRIEAHLIDALLLVIVSFILLILAHLGLSNASFYKDKENILTQEMVKCYEIEEEAKNVGIDAFISKPLFKSKLTKLFKELVEVEHIEQEKDPVEQISKLDYSDKRILVAEDNEINREIAVEIIKMTGAKTEEADNGKMAVDMVINKWRKTP